MDAAASTLRRRWLWGIAHSCNLRLLGSSDIGPNKIAFVSHWFLVFNVPFQSLGPVE